MLVQAILSNTKIKMERALLAKCLKKLLVSAISAVAEIL